jgi:hypothetical protein
VGDRGEKIDGSIYRDSHFEDCIPSAVRKSLIVLNSEAQPPEYCGLDGKAEPFRSSGGKAAGKEEILRDPRELWFQTRHMRRRFRLTGCSSDFILP